VVTAVGYLGWNPAEVRIGPSVLDAAGAVRLDPGPGMHPRDCAPAAGAVLVAAEGPGGDALLLLRPGAPARTVARGLGILAVAMDAEGTRGWYTVAHGLEGGAEVWTVDLAGGEPRRAWAGCAVDSPLAWMPDGRVAFHGTDEWIRVAGPGDGEPVRVAAGRSPAADGTGRLAYLRGRAVVVRGADGAEREWPLPRTIGRPSLARVLSWSPDGREVSWGRTAGLVGKRTDFFLLDVQTGRSHRVPQRYLAGLRLTAPAPEWR
jgi:hypothetical protein